MESARTENQPLNLTEVSHWTWVLFLILWALGFLRNPQSSVGQEVSNVSFLWGTNDNYDS